MEIFKEVSIMKGEKVRALLKKNSVKVGGVVLAAVVALGSFWALNTREAVPELVTFVDTDGNVEIKGEGVPLAAPKVTKTTKTQKKTKKIKMKKKATKTYVKKEKSTKKQTRTINSSTQKTQIVTVVDTNVVNNYKKNSNINKQVTTTKTTTTTTVTTYEQPNSQSNGTSTLSNTPQTQATQQNAPAAAQTNAAAETTFTAAGEYNVAQAAPVVNSKVANAFQKMGFKIVVNPSVSYAGLFDARSQSITMKKINTTVYHELGHFVAFLAGNYDMSAEFKAIFEKEKALYTMSNKAYVLQNSAEYFAESFKNYTLEPAQLKASRPATFQAIETALARITDAQVDQYIATFQGIWSTNS